MHQTTPLFQQIAQLDVAAVRAHDAVLDSFLFAHFEGGTRTYEMQTSVVLSRMVAFLCHVRAAAVAAVVAVFSTMYTKWELCVLPARNDACLFLRPVCY